MKPSLIVFISLLALTLFAAPIPREAPRDFFKQGLFEGGEPKATNLEAIRVARHNTFERWVIDFSDVGTRKVGAAAPEFSVRYRPAAESPTGEMLSTDSGRFQILFRRINRNFISLETQKRLGKKSALVKDVLIYPAIEDGDTAMELVLRPGVTPRFKAHRPGSPESGKLVLDIALASSTSP